MAVLLDFPARGSKEPLIFHPERSCLLAGMLQPLPQIKAAHTQTGP